MSDKSPITRFTKELLDAIGGTQAEQAALLGVSDMAIHYWRSGRNKPRLSNLLALCDAAGQEHRKFEARALMLAELEEPVCSTPPEAA